MDFLVRSDKFQTVVVVKAGNTPQTSERLFGIHADDQLEGDLQQLIDDLNSTILYASRLHLVHLRSHTG